MMAKGWMYANGRGVAQDPVQAYVWSALAAIRIPEEAEARGVAIVNRDWAESHLSEEDVAKARRMVDEESLRSNDS